MANGGFTLGGSTAKSLGLILLRSSQRPVIPSTQDYIQSIPYRPGAYDFGADLQPNLFILECAFVKTNSTTLQTAVNNLAAFLVDTNGQPRSLNLVLDANPIRTYSVRYSGQLPMDRVSGLGRLSLPLIAFDPLAYAAITAFDENNQYDTGLQYDSGLIYDNPASFSWIYASHMSGIYNWSKITTPLIVTITGTVTNPNITNADTGESIALTYALSGQTLIIDGNRRTITIDGVNAMQYLSSGDFVNLLQGSNGLTFSGTSPNATVTYSWLHKFV